MGARCARQGKTHDGHRCTQVARPSATLTVKAYIEGTVQSPSTAGSARAVRLAKSPRAYGVGGAALEGAAGPQTGGAVSAAGPALRKLHRGLCGAGGPARCRGGWGLPRSAPHRRCSPRPGTSEAGVSGTARPIRARRRAPWYRSLARGSGSRPHSSRRDERGTTLVAVGALGFVGSTVAPGDPSGFLMRLLNGCTLCGQWEPTIYVAECRASGEKQRIR
jgi:hypothetical protein